jgi:hypothetical protein
LQYLQQPNMAACMGAPAGLQQQQAAEHMGQPEQQQSQLQMQERLADASGSSSSTADLAAAAAPADAATDAEAVSAAAADDDAHARVLQLLPGLSPAMLPAVAARMLDGAAVTLGRRLGCGAFATVYEAQLAGSRAKWVVKRLDRVALEHAQQVRRRRELQLFSRICMLVPSQWVVLHQLCDGMFIEACVRCS